MKSSKPILHRDSNGYLTTLRSQNRASKAPPTRIKLQQVLTQITICCAISSALLVAFIWLYARSSGALNYLVWGQYHGNHGPWRHFPFLRDLWWYVLYFMVFCCVPALGAFLVKPRFKSLLPVIYMMAQLCFFFYTCYWLVD